MSKLNLVITEQAYNDLDLISDYIAQDNVDAAKRFLSFLIENCRTLALYPNLGVKRPDFSYKDVLFYIVKKRYVIIYKIENDTLYIVRVLTAYQDICALL
jgi:addiction module RelE/StbE family toxin